MESTRSRSHVLIAVLMFVLCHFQCSAQEIMSLPFSYSDWKSYTYRFYYPEDIGMQYVWTDPMNLTLRSLHEDEHARFVLITIDDQTYNEGLYLGYLLVYGDRSTFIPNPDPPFATYEFDYGLPVSLINVICQELVANGISRQDVASSIRGFIAHRLVLNTYGPGDGYYESLGYSRSQRIVFDDTPLLEEFVHEYPFLIGISIPEQIDMLREFAETKGYVEASSLDAKSYGEESRVSVKDMLITLYMLLSPDGHALNKEHGRLEARAVATGAPGLRK